jgi:hypothetical protein
MIKDMKFLRRCSCQPECKLYVWESASGNWRTLTLDQHQAEAYRSFWKAWGGPDRSKCQVWCGWYWKDALASQYHVQRAGYSHQYYKGGAGHGALDRRFCSPACRAAGVPGR